MRQGLPMRRERPCHARALAPTRPRKRPGAAPRVALACADPASALPKAVGPEHPLAAAAAAAQSDATHRRSR